MSEYQLRQEAIRRYLTGEKISKIAQSLKKSRKWLHTWIKRFNEKKDSNWFKDLSKTPLNIKSTLTEETEQQILLIRRDLMNEKMAQIGAISIQYEFEKRGIKPLPDVWTINRTIRKNGLSKQPSNHKKTKDYPELYWHVHQMDLVGPRYIKGDGRFYSINIIDITTHSCFVKAVRTKSSNGIVDALATFWKTHGLPDALQMDNELAFRGSNRYPRSFGAVVRFALSQGVAVIFIPVGEPWRNGIIEKFNDTYQLRFLRAYSFDNLEQLSQKEQLFINFHNSNHRYSSQSHKTPNEAKALQMPAILYKGVIHLPSLKNEIIIPLNKGCIYFIRFIRSDLKLNLINEIFIVKDNLKYSYVVAEINIENHSLVIRQNDEIIQTFPYDISAINW